ncbi:MAG: phosphoribosylanthranilate isomerase [Candidatus Acetothermia bacterium]
MVKVKICGNQTRDDIDASAGADAVGFIISTPESSRNLTPGRAAKLVESVPLFTDTVLVTTETKPEKLARLSERVAPDYLQLHSRLSEGELRKIDSVVPGLIDLIGLLPVEGSGEELERKARDLKESPVSGILLDSKSGGRSGGTGETHDWELSKRIRKAVDPFPVILAGGLEPGNVRKAVEKVKPYAVDAASGLEIAGEKSPEKTNQFLKEVKENAT